MVVDYKTYIMLETNLTMYQSLGTLEQKEYLQRLINLLNTSKHACDSISSLIDDEEVICKNNNLKLPINPFYQQIEL